MDTALKVSRSLYCFTTSVSHGVENYFPRLWGMDISDAILSNLIYKTEALCDLYRYRKIRNKNVEIYRKIYELL